MEPGSSSSATSQTLLNLPPAIYVGGRYPNTSPNIYSKPDLISFVRVNVQPYPEVFERIHNSQFGRLFDLPVNLLPISCKLLHALVVRQREIKKKYEMWSVYGGHPFRFSLAEFGGLSGLCCADFEEEYNVKEDGTDVPSDGEDSEIWRDMFGDVPHNSLLAELGSLLEDSSEMSPERRLRIALLVLVDGVLIANYQVHRPTMKYVRLLQVVDKFLAFPWGRESFWKTIQYMVPSHLPPPTQPKKLTHMEYWKVRMGQTTTAFKGFPLMLNLFAFRMFPELLDYLPCKDLKPTLMTSAWIGDTKCLTLNRKAVNECEEKIKRVAEPIVEVDEDLYPEYDDEYRKDKSVRYLVKLIGDGHIFKRENWHGGDESNPVYTKKRTNTPAANRRRHLVNRAKGRAGQNKVLIDADVNDMDHDLGNEEEDYPVRRETKKRRGRSRGTALQKKKLKKKTHAVKDNTIRKYMVKEGSPRTIKELKAWFDVKLEELHTNQKNELDLMSKRLSRFETRGEHLMCPSLCKLYWRRRKFARGKLIVSKNVGNVIHKMGVNETDRSPDGLGGDTESGCSSKRHRSNEEGSEDVTQLSRKAKLHECNEELVSNERDLLKVAGSGRVVDTEDNEEVDEGDIRCPYLLDEELLLNQETSALSEPCGLQASSQMKHGGADVNHFAEFNDLEECWKLCASVSKSVLENPSMASFTQLVNAVEHVSSQRAEVEDVNRVGLGCAVDGATTEDNKECSKNPDCDVTNQGVFPNHVDMDEGTALDPVLGSTLTALSSDTGLEVVDANAKSGNVSEESEEAVSEGGEEEENQDYGQKVCGQQETVGGSKVVECTTRSDSVRVECKNLDCEDGGQKVDGQQMTTDITNVVEWREANQKATLVKSTCVIPDASDVHDEDNIELSLRVKKPTTKGKRSKVNKLALVKTPRVVVVTEEFSKLPTGLAELMTEYAAYNCNVIVPEVPRSLWDRFVAYLQSVPKMSFATNRQERMTGKFLVEIGKPTQWVTSLHMDILMDYVAVKHFSVAKNQGVQFAASWLTKKLYDLKDQFASFSNKRDMEWGVNIEKYVKIVGQVWFKNVHSIYIPMLWDKRRKHHWVGLVIHLPCWRICVLDPNPSFYRDSEMAEYMDPTSAMIPFIVDAFCPITASKTYGTKPMTYIREPNLYKNLRGGDCGPVSVKFLEMYVNATDTQMEKFTDADVDNFRRGYAFEIFRNFIVPLISQ